MGPTPEREKVAMWERFRRRVDVDQLTRDEIQQEADQFFRDEAGATQMRIDAVLGGARAKQAEALQRAGFESIIRGSEAGIVFRTAQGTFDLAPEGVTSRRVSFPNYEAVQLVDRESGRIITQRKVGE